MALATVALNTAMMTSSIQTLVEKGAGFVNNLFEEAFNFLRNLFQKKELPQDYLIEGIPEKGDLLYKQEIRRSMKTPYTLRYRRPGTHITAISCVPKDPRLAAPSAEITDGGLFCDYVVMVLTPSTNDPWGCVIDICSAPDEHQ